VKEILLRVEGLTTHLSTGRGVVRAVEDVSLELERSMTLAIVGESGSGKTVLTRSIMRLQPTASIVRSDGRVFLDGVDLMTLSTGQLRRVWGSRIGLVSQNPMTALNPVVRIGRQICEVISKNDGVGGREAKRRAIELLNWVEIPEPERRLGQYPHQLSGGLRQRVTIAIAISCRPDLLIADEPTTALDVTVQAQILALLERLQREHGMAMIFVSHDLGVVAGLADEIAVMYAGRIVERASGRQLFRHPRMRYSEALLAAAPRIGQAIGRLHTIPGRPPDMITPPSGCRFHPRCEYASDVCRTVEPMLNDAEDGHRFACWHPAGDDAAGEDAAGTQQHEEVAGGR
jgi:oligopeptide/dipeptide ABC transporter ATP-binding protein